MKSNEILIAVVVALGFYTYYNQKPKDNISPVDPHITPEEEKKPYDINREFCDDKCGFNYTVKKSKFI
jgi:hypothetical protein